MSDSAPERGAAAQPTGSSSMTPPVLVHNAAGGGRWGTSRASRFSTTDRVGGSINLTAGHVSPAAGEQHEPGAALDASFGSAAPWGATPISRARRPRSAMQSTRNRRSAPQYRPATAGRVGHDTSSKSAKFWHAAATRRRSVAHRGTAGAARRDYLLGEVSRSAARIRGIAGDDPVSDDHSDDVQPSAHNDRTPGVGKFLSRKSSVSQARPSHILRGAQLDTQGVRLARVTTDTTEARTYDGPARQSVHRSASRPSTARPGGRHGRRYNSGTPVSPTTLAGRQVPRMRPHSAAPAARSSRRLKTDRPRSAAATSSAVETTADVLEAVGGGGFDFYQHVVGKPAVDPTHRPASAGAGHPRSFSTGKASLRPTLEHVRQWSGGRARHVSNEIPEDGNLGLFGKPAGATDRWSSELSAPLQPSHDVAVPRSDCRKVHRFADDILRGILLDYIPPLHVQTPALVTTFMRRRTCRLPPSLLVEEASTRVPPSLQLESWFDLIDDSALEMVRRVGAGHVRELGLSGVGQTRGAFPELTASGTTGQAAESLAGIPSAIHGPKPPAPPPLGRATQEVLTRLLVSCTGLRALDLSRSTIVGAPLIAAVSQELRSSLRTLSLAGIHNLSEHAIMALRGGCASLEVLDLSSRGSICGDKGVSATLSVATNLTALGLRQSRMTPRAWASLGRMRGLQVLDLRGSEHLRNEDLCSVLQPGLSRTLRSLDISGCISISDDGLSALTQKLGRFGPALHGGFTALRRLRIAGLPRISDLSLSWIAGGASGLEVLDASHAGKLGITGVAAVGTLSRLRVLRLAGCASLTDEHMIAMIIATNGEKATVRGRGCLPILRVLDVSDCPELSDDSMEMVFQRLTTLRGIYLAGSRRISDTTLCTAARCCRLLEKLQARGLDRVTNLAVTELALNSRHLAQLDVSLCVRLDGGCIRQFHRMYRLSHLNLGGCWRIDDESVSDLTAYELRWLGLAGLTQMTDLSLRQLLNNHSMLATLDIAGCPCVTDSLVDELTAMARCGSASSERIAAGSPLPLTTVNLSGCSGVSLSSMLRLANALSSHGCVPIINGRIALAVRDRSKLDGKTCAYKLRRAKHDDSAAGKFQVSSGGLRLFSDVRLQNRRAIGTRLGERRADWADDVRACNAWACGPSQEFDELPYSTWLDHDSTDTCTPRSAASAFIGRDFTGLIPDPVFCLQLRRHRYEAREAALWRAAVSVQAAFRMHILRKVWRKARSIRANRLFSAVVGVQARVKMILARNRYKRSRKAGAVLAVFCTAKFIARKNRRQWLKACRHYKRVQWKKTARGLGDNAIDMKQQRGQQSAIARGRVAQAHYRGVLLAKKLEDWKHWHRMHVSDTLLEKRAEHCRRRRLATKVMRSLRSVVDRHVARRKLLLNVFLTCVRLSARNAEHGRSLRESADLQGCRRWLRHGFAQLIAGREHRMSMLLLSRKHYMFWGKKRKKARKWFHGWVQFTKQRKSEVLARLHAYSHFERWSKRRGLFMLRWFAERSRRQRYLRGLVTSFRRRHRKGYAFQGWLAGTREQQLQRMKQQAAVRTFFLRWVGKCFLAWREEYHCRRIAKRNQHRTAMRHLGKRILRKWHSRYVTVKSRLRCTIHILERLGLRIGLQRWRAGARVVQVEQVTGWLVRRNEERAAQLLQSFMRERTKHAKRLFFAAMARRIQHMCSAHLRRRLFRRDMRILRLREWDVRHEEIMQMDWEDRLAHAVEAEHTASARLQLAWRLMQRRVELADIRAQRLAARLARERQARAEAMIKYNKWLLHLKWLAKQKEKLARMLQRCWRGRLGRILFQQVLHHAMLNRTATTIQATVRGILARRRVNCIRRNHWNVDVIRQRRYNETRILRLFGMKKRRAQAIGREVLHVLGLDLRLIQMQTSPMPDEVKVDFSEWRTRLKYLKLMWHQRGYSREKWEARAALRRERDKTLGVDFKARDTVRVIDATHRMFGRTGVILRVKPGRYAGGQCVVKFDHDLAIRHIGMLFGESEYDDPGPAMVHVPNCNRDIFVEPASVRVSSLILEEAAEAERDYWIPFRAAKKIQKHWRAYHARVSFPTFRREMRELRDSARERNRRRLRWLLADFKEVGKFLELLGVRPAHIPEMEEFNIVPRWYRRLQKRLVLNAQREAEIVVLMNARQKWAFHQARFSLQDRYQGPGIPRQPRHDHDGFTEEDRQLIDRAEKWLAEHGGVHAPLPVVPGVHKKADEAHLWESSDEEIPGLSRYAKGRDITVAGARQKDNLRKRRIQMRAAAVVKYAADPTEEEKKFEEQKAKAKKRAVVEVGNAVSAFRMGIRNKRAARRQRRKDRLFAKRRAAGGALALNDIDDEDRPFIPNPARINQRYYEHHEPVLRWRQRDDPSALAKDALRLRVMRATNFKIADWIQRRHLKNLRLTGEPPSYHKWALKIGGREWTRSDTERRTWAGRYRLKWLQEIAHVRAEGWAIFHGPWWRGTPHGEGYIAFLTDDDRFIPEKSRKKVVLSEQDKKDIAEQRLLDDLAARQRGTVANAKRSAADLAAKQGKFTKPGDDEDIETRKNTLVDQNERPSSFEAAEDDSEDDDEPLPERFGSCNGLFYKQMVGTFKKGVLRGFVNMWYNNGAEYLGPYVHLCPLCHSDVPEANGSPYLDRGHGAGDVLDNRKHYSFRPPEHWGVWMTEDRVRYEGWAVDNHFDVRRATGQFHVTSEDSLYIGQLVRGLRHGQGRCLWRDGKVYEGEWRLGEMTGTGTFVQSTGDRYDGNFVRGVPYGSGVEVVDGVRYAGEFRAGVRHGHGKMEYPNGLVFFGQFKHGRKIGTGTAWYPDGSKYIGTWENDKRNGRGTLWFANGDRYEGPFVNGEMHGVGIWSSFRALDTELPPQLASDLAEAASKRIAAARQAREANDTEGPAVLRQALKARIEKQNRASKPRGTDSTGNLSERSANRDDVACGATDRPTGHGTTNVAAEGKGIEDSNSHEDGGSSDPGVESAETPLLATSLSPSELQPRPPVEEQQSTVEGKGALGASSARHADRLLEWNRQVRFERGERMEYLDFEVCEYATVEFVASFQEELDYTGPRAMGIARKLPYLPGGVDPDNKLVKAIVERIAVEGRGITCEVGLDRVRKQLRDKHDEVVRNQKRTEEIDVRANEHLLEMQVQRELAKQQTQRVNQLQARLDKMEDHIEAFWRNEPSNVRENFAKQCDRMYKIPSQEWYKVRVLVAPLPKLLRDLTAAVGLLFRMPSLEWKHVKLLVSDNMENSKHPGTADHLLWTYPVRMLWELKSGRWDVFAMAKSQNYDFALKYMAEPDLRPDNLELEAVSVAAQEMCAWFRIAYNYISAARNVVDVVDRVGQMKKIAQQARDALDVTLEKMRYQAECYETQVALQNSRKEVCAKAESDLIELGKTRDAALRWVEANRIALEAERLEADVAESARMEAYKKRINKERNDERLYREAKAKHEAKVAVLRECGWDTALDGESGAEYWFHRETQDVNWTMPDIEGSDEHWTQVSDVHSGLSFWYNTKTHQKLWDTPKGVTIRLEGADGDVGSAFARPKPPGKPPHVVAALDAARAERERLEMEKKLARVALTSTEKNRPESGARRERRRGRGRKLRRGRTTSTRGSSKAKR